MEKKRDRKTVLVNSVTLALNDLIGELEFEEKHYAANRLRKISFEIRSWAEAE